MIPDERLLLAHRRFYYLTNEQVARLFGWSKKQTASDKTRDHREAGYLEQVQYAAPTGRGSTQFVHTLGLRGRQLLGLGNRWRPAEQRQRHPIHLLHTLAVNDVLISLTLLPDRVPAVTEVDFVHELDLKREPIIVVKRKVIPDGWTDVWSTSARDCVLLEIDRDSQDYKPIRDKVEGLCLALGTPYKTRFGTENFTGVAFVTTDRRRRDALTMMIERALTELGRLDEEHKRMFYVTAADPVEKTPEWFWLMSHWRQPFSKEVHHLIPL